MSLILYLKISRANWRALGVFFLAILMAINPYYAVGRTVLAQVETEIPSQTIYEAINARISDMAEGVSSLSDLQLNDFTMESADQPSNLYLLLYQLKESDSHEGALAQTAVESGYDYFTVRNAIEQGSLDDLGQGVADQQTELQRLRSLYEAALPIQQTRFNLVIQNHFQQVFADGDSLNADFDLILDLQEMHDQLFVGKPPTFFEADPSYPVNPNFQRPRQELPSKFESNQSAQIAENGEVSPNFCPVDPALSAALLASNSLQEQEGEVVSNNSQIARSGNSRGASGNFVASLFEDVIPDSPIPCEPGQFFCATLEKEYDYAQNYFPGEQTCVACRFAKINENMAKLMGDTLYPGKITGKLGELAECKDAFYTLPLDVNISFLPNPVPKYNEKVAEQIAKQKAADLAEKLKQQPQDISYLNSQQIGNTSSSILDIIDQRGQILAATNQQAINQSNVKKSSLTAPTVDVGIPSEVVQKIQEFNQYLIAYQKLLLEISALVEVISQKPNCS